MNKILLTLGIAALVGTVQAQEATFYRGFAELKTPVTLPAGEWTWQPGRPSLRPWFPEP